LGDPSGDGVETRESVERVEAGREAAQSRAEGLRFDAERVLAVVDLALDQGDLAL
jgi:hypothetical protein